MPKFIVETPAPIKRLNAPAGYLNLEDVTHQVKQLNDMLLARKATQINEYALDSATTDLMAKLLKQASTEVDMIADELKYQKD